MGTAALTHTLTAGTNENVNHVQENLEDLRDFLNGGNVGPENLEIFPSARVHNSANISVANNTSTALTFDSERFDNASIHSTSSNTGRLTAPEAGLYLVTFSLEWAANATNQRYASIRLNGTTTIASEQKGAAAAGTTAHTVSTVYRLAQNDYVEAMAFQNSGGALNALATGNYSPEFSIVLLGRYS